MFFPVEEGGYISGFPVIVSHLKRALNSTQVFLLLFCSGGMGGGVSSKNAHKSSFMHRFPNISGLEFKNYTSSLLSIWAHLVK